MKKALLSITVLGLILFFGMTAANAQTIQDIAKKGLASTVSLVMDNDGYGSGFFVLSDQIATAYHVVEGASSGYVSPVHQEDKYPIVGITAIDKDNDLVILKVSGAHGTPLLIGDSRTVEIQHEVIVVGNPLGYEGTVTDGKIINNSLGNRLLTDATINRGNSGGAVLNSPKGEVIGVAIEKRTDIVSVPGSGNINVAQGLNIVVPSKYLTPLVEKAKDNHGYLKPLSVDGVTGTHLAWGGYGYTFTLHNQRNETIYDPHCLVIFKDNKGIICMDQFKIPNQFLFAGQVSREIRITDTDLLLSDYYNKVLNAPSDSHINSSLVGPRVRQLMKSYEIRILDFDIVLHITRALGMSLVPLEGVTGNDFTWVEGDLGWRFSYSLQNHLSEDVKDIVSYVVFYDKEGAPIAESLESRNQEIPAMGTLQVERGPIGDYVKQLTKQREYKIYQLKYKEYQNP